MLVGREPERALLGALVDDARDGTAGAVVVRGDPGVGKSALLDALATEATDVRLLRTQGLEVEAPLPFAALHRLLLPLTRLRDQLPPPQARALGVAFGEDDGPSVEPFLVGVATLSLLTSAGEEGPVLCIVDDAHWLDPASAGALLFCARRLGADRVAMVFSAREGTAARFEAPGVDEVVLDGLDEDASRALLARQLGGSAAAGVVARLVEESRGNPLALLELPRELDTAQLTGAAPLPAQLHLTERVEQAFLDRSRRLPVPVQRMVLLAAADDSGRLDVVRDAARRLGLDEHALRAAVESGLILQTDDVVALRHPLVRSAIYQAAADDDRRQAHRALADSLSSSGEADRAVWHRAFAANDRGDDHDHDHDDDLVDALADVGARSGRRGGYVAALAAYERAASLSTDPARRAGLMFAAARSAWACGQAERARALLTAAREVTEDPVLVCDIASLRGHIEVNIGSAPEGHRIFVEAAHAVCDVDAVRALQMGVLAAVMRTFGADSGTPLRFEDLLTATAGDDTVRTRCLRAMLVSMTEVADNRWAAAVDALALAFDLGGDVDDRDVLWNLGNAALQLGDDEGQRRFYSHALSRARESGAVTAVIYCLQRLCFVHFVTGDHLAVRVSAEEALALGEGIGQPAMTALPVAWLALLAAHQGSDEYDDLACRLETLVAAHPLGITADPVHDLTRWAAAVRGTGRGDTAGALHHFSRIRLSFVARMVATQRLEAAARAGDATQARVWTDELEEFANEAAQPWARSAVAFGRSVTKDGDVEKFFQLALAEGRGREHPLDVARIELAYGEWLRRQQRRVDARQHLRHALDTFTDVRASAWSSRAEQELRASGETARKRDPSTQLQLTPMERKVAQLVSSGMSNKDVAAQCWISPRTVAFHLRNVFTKAGVTSRGELAQLDLS
ncbi:helix-turn-helix transcriptional regulator [Nocardioides zhouii]|uniref:Helix-turn-helix transcriptional regulator n=1 Tax=Nocardioides zhouii TaxID=1168729 RepID=A0A4Q2SUB3_9ACTN|nr:helix-turn-helix transcriptional regulator [Nocardioides zhouii]RYC09596.1 helix-turn-helix transcriptional regulator [Nocardioides zhouii]